VTLVEGVGVTAQYGHREGVCKGRQTAEDQLMHACFHTPRCITGSRIEGYVSIYGNKAYSQMHHRE
jgi:hypothetical protein